jgi:hypothetical protein
MTIEAAALANSVRFNEGECRNARRGRSIGSTLLPARRSAVMKSRPVPRASPSAMPADCGRCQRPGLGISTTIPFLGLFQPFFPLVFALDLSRLE